MRVLLIGVGAVGSVVARHLSAHRAISGLTLADFDTRRAEALARDLASGPSAGPGGAPGGAARAGTPDRIRVQALDAGDPAAVRRALAGHGLMVNAVVPRFNGPLMDAAFEAGCLYLDLCTGDEDQTARHAAWRDAGRTALCDMGEDPGISNILARHGADRLDTVETIRVRDGEFSTSDDLPLACLFSTETFIEEAVSGSKSYADGAWREHPPWSGREVYPFPPPVGPQPLYLMAHEEVDTLPRFIGKGVRHVDFKLAIPDDMRQALTFLDRIGMTRRDEVRVGRAAVRPLAVLSAVLPQPADLGGRIRGAAIILVEVEGTKDGRPARRVLHVAMTHEEAFRRARTTATAYLTGTGGAVGALALATGVVSSPGVHVPEQIEPGPLLALLAELGLEAQERTEAPGA